MRGFFPVVAASVVVVLAACSSGSVDDAGDSIDSATDDTTSGSDTARADSVVGDADVDAVPNADAPKDTTVADSVVPPSDSGPDPTDRSKCTIDPDKAFVTHRTAKTSTGGSMKYVGFAPTGYDPKSPLTLVIALHGAGDTMDNYFAAVWQSNASSKKFLVVTPEGSAAVGPGFTWNGSDANSILDVIDDFAACYSVDPRKRIIHGFSAGGVMAYLIGLQAAELFSGISISSSDLGTAEAIAGKRLVPGVAAWKIPLSQTHGTSDTNFPIAQARAGRDRLIAAGHKFDWHEFAGGHTTSASLVGMTYDDLAGSTSP